MTELMAHSTNTVNTTSTTIQFRTASVAVHHKISCNSYSTTAITIICCFRQCVCMWPDSILLTFSIRCAISCIYTINLVNITVNIPVILCPVADLTFCQLHSFTYHLTGKFINTFIVVSTIIRHILAYCNRSYNIKIKFKLSTALSFEIVTHRSLEFAFRESFLICYSLVE